LLSSERLECSSGDTVIYNTIEDREISLANVEKARTYGMVMILLVRLSRTVNLLFASGRVSSLVMVEVGVEHGVVRPALLSEVIDLIVFK